MAEQFLGATAGFRAVDARTVHPDLSPALVDARGHFERRRTGTVSRRSSARSSGASDRAAARCNCVRAEAEILQVRFSKMAFRTRVWSFGKLLILLAALVGTYGLFAAASMRMALRAREVEVPNLIERTVSEAGAMAAAQEPDHHVWTKPRRPDPKIPVDHVTRSGTRAGLNRARAAKRARSG